MSIGSLVFLKNLQTTKKQTHEERKQVLEAWHSWENYKQLESKPKKKEIKHWKNKTKS
jgi:hypothetical protein